MKKTISKTLLMASLVISTSIFSQTWLGSTTSLNNTYRTGNVGIGVSNPLTKLHLSMPSGTGFQIDHTDIGNYGYAQVNNVSSDLTKAFAVQRVNGTTSTSMFLIWGNGVVNAKTIYAEAVTVTPTAIGISWPDYVFKRGYKLMPLTDLEKFIKTNYHLPNVPSAEELSKEGVNLYEINKALLEKVEELSLYVIELNKEIETLKQKNN